MEEEKRLLLTVHHREAIVESLYVEHLHTTVRFLIGISEDHDILLDYIGQVAHDTDPLNIASRISRENQRDFYSSVVQECIQQSLAVLVTDCFEVFGVGIARILQNSDDKRLLELDSDYSEKINQSNAKSEEAKFISTFLDELYSYTSNFLPESKFMQIDLINLHPEYQDGGVGHRLLKEMLRLAKKCGVNFVVVGCTSNKLKKLCEKFHFQSKFTFPYAKFVCNSEPVFGEQLIDDSTEAHLMIVNLNEIEDLLKEELPVLPNAYKLPKTSRTLVDTLYVEKLACEIRFEIAVPEDEPVIRDFMINEYYRQTNIPRTLQCRKEDSVDLMTRFKPEVIGLGLVILAIDQGKLCGLSINRGITLEKETKQDVKEIKIPDDFTSLIDAQPLNHIGGKTVRAINAWMESFVPQFLPTDCDRYFCLNMLTIHPDYRGCKIANKLWMDALKLGQSKGYRYAQCMCSAGGSNKVAENVGLKMVIKLNYDQITYQGKKLFKDGKVNDGGREFNMFIDDLNEILPPLQN